MVGTSSVLKKMSPNGKLTLFLRCRDYSSTTEPVDGVVEIDTSYLKQRKVFGHLIAHFRYGREKDEVMGIKFFRDFILASTQIYPTKPENKELTDVQSAIIEKLDYRNVYPFIFHFPKAAPTSVTLQSRETEEHAKACGVHYFVRVFVGENESDIPHHRSSAKLNIRRIQYAPFDLIKNPSHTLVKQHFVVCKGDVELEASIDKQLYELDEKIPVNITIQNNSNKVVRKIQVALFQHVSIQMLQTGQYKHVISEYMSKNGCPIQPGSCLQAIVYVKPSLNGNRKKGGMALDGHHRREDCDLAASTFLHHNSVKDAFGIIVNYFIRVRLHLGALNGDVTAELPILVMPAEPEKGG